LEQRFTQLLRRKAKYLSFRSLGRKTFSRAGSVDNTFKYAPLATSKRDKPMKELRLELGRRRRINDRHDGVGLSEMRERVEQMGGELEITSSSGQNHRPITVQWRIDVVTSKKVYKSQSYKKASRLEIQEGLGLLCSSRTITA
jgi:hypothetical protein